MFKNGKFFLVFIVICFLMGTINVAQGKELPADVEAWLKENKIGPFQENEVDYDALYQAAKKEGKVVVYSDTSRGPKSLALGFYDKYPGIKVEWNTIGSANTVNRTFKEQKARIYTVDVVYSSGAPAQVGLLQPANMIFRWIPPDVKKVIPKEYQEPLLAHRDTAQTLFYNLHTWPDKPPIESWWDVTRPEWKRRLVVSDPRAYTSALHLFTTFVLNAEEMAKDYERVFGKPLKLTTPNAGYEWLKMLYANKPKFVRNPKEAKYIGEAGQAKPSLGICWALARITDSDNPKYGKVRYSPHLTLKPRVGMRYPTYISIAYRAPHPNAAKLLIRWLFGNEKGGGGTAPWYTPGHLLTRVDIKDPAPHPFNPNLSFNPRDFNWWIMDPRGVWEKQKEVLDFVNRLF